MTYRRRDHRVLAGRRRPDRAGVRAAGGWAFLGLGTALAWSGLTDVYAELALTWRPDAPAGALAATLSDTSFVWWFVFLALVLQFTPPARATRRGSSAALPW